MDSVRAPPGLGQAVLCVLTPARPRRTRLKSRSFVQHLRHMQHIRVYVYTAELGRNLGAVYAAYAHMPQVLHKRPELQSHGPGPGWRQHTQNSLTKPRRSSNTVHLSP